MTSIGEVHRLTKSFQFCEGGDGWKPHYNGVLAWIQSRQDCSDVDPFLTSVFAMMATQVLLHNPGVLLQRSHDFLDAIMGLQARDSGIVDVMFGCPLDFPHWIVRTSIDIPPRSV